MITYQNKIDSLVPNVIVPGSKFYIDSTNGNDNNAGSKLAPFKTTTEALSHCTANAGDYIYLMPGFSESITTAGGLDIDKAGVTIVGLGRGTKMPIYSWGAADATMVIDENNVRFENVNFQAAFADVAVGIDVGAVDTLEFYKCKFTESTTNKNWVIIIDLATGAANILVDQCQVFCGDAANDSFINGVACSGLTVLDSQIYFQVAQAAACGQIATSGNSTFTTIKRCDFVSLVDGALHIDLNGAANTGIIAECYFSSIDTAGAVTTAIDATGCHVFECYVAGEADSFGLVGGGTVYNNS